MRKVKNLKGKASLIFLVPLIIMMKPFYKGISGVFFEGFFKFIVAIKKPLSYKDSKLLIGLNFDIGDKLFHLSILVKRRSRLGT